MGKLHLGITRLTHYSILLLIQRNTNSSANYTAEFKLQQRQPNHQIFNSSLGTDPDSSWCCLPASRHVTRLRTPGEIPWDAGDPKPQPSPNKACSQNTHAAVQRVVQPLAHSITDPSTTPKRTITEYSLRLLIAGGRPGTTST